MSKYNYLELPSKNDIVYKPYVYVRLGYKKTHKVTTSLVAALVDSGSDVCFCRKDIGVWLGVNFKNKENLLFTAANKTSFQAQREKIYLYFNKRMYECPFYFLDNLPQQTPIILGQKGFFDHFKIVFDLKNKEIEIT